MREVSILGATGSVGGSALGLIRRFGGHFRLKAASAHRDVARLARVACEFRPDLVAIGDERLYSDLKEAVAHLPVEVVPGQEGLERAARAAADIVVSAIVGIAGLAPSLSAISSGCRGRVLALANKESLVVAGSLLLERARQFGVHIFPLDSEHHALFELIGGHAGFNEVALEPVDRLVVMASGGPFWRWSKEDLGQVTVEQACRHPIWSMGPKISVDSATLVNKALELAEASILFSKPESDIDVLVHERAFVHAMVICRSGTARMHAGAADMRIPIASALFWPLVSPRIDGIPSAALLPGTLEFEDVDHERFPAVSIMRSILRSREGREKSLLLTVFNAANEFAVRAFLVGSIGFSDIVPCIEKALIMVNVSGVDPTLENIYAIDATTRRVLEAAYV